MDARVRRALTVLRAVVHEVRTERVTFMAGSIAYHAFVSLLPLLVLLFALVSTVGRGELAETLVAMTRAALTPGAGDVLVRELRTTSPGVSALGGIVLLWGTLRIFRGLDTAFSDIYESESANTFADQFRDGLLVLASVALAVVVAVWLESAFLAGYDGAGAWLLRRLAMVVGLGLVFLPMYYVFPDQEDMAVAEVLPGTAFAAVGLTAFESLFRFYVAYSSRNPSGSFLASVVVFLTWLYFSGLVVLVGVAINAVLSNRSRDVNVRPVLGGVARDAESGTNESSGGESRSDGPRADADRAELVDALRRLGDRLPAAASVTVTVDGESVSLPPPDRVDTDTEESSLPFVGGSVGVALRWSPGRDRE